MLDLNELVNSKLNEMIDSGTIEQRIQKALEIAVTKSIDEQFASYDGLRKQLETAMKEGLKINCKDLPFEVYNQQMSVLVKQRLGSFFAAEASTKFMAEMDKVLAPAPTEMSAKELVETIAGFWKSDEPWDADELDDDATVELETHDYPLDGSYSLRMWKKHISPSYPSTRRTSADINLYITSEGGIRINHLHGYNPTCFSEKDAFIFKLYAAGTIITGLADFDPDFCDLTLKNDDY